MASIWYRSDRAAWYVDLVLPGGRRITRRAGTTKAEAQRVKRELEAALREQPASVVPLSVAEAAKEWLALRAKDPDIRDSRHVKQHLRTHILARFGSVSVTAMSRGEVVKFVRELREEGLAPKSVRNIHGTLHALFAWLVVEREVLAANPCTLGRGRLPRATPAQKRRYRDHHTFDRDEIEILISASKIPADRRILYALQFFTGARRSEVLELRWPDYDERAKPLGRITIERSLGHYTTKTDTPRAMPVHPTLAAMLAEWKLSGFATLVKRSARHDDLIVPRADGLARTVSWTSELLARDLDAVGLRRRGTHSFRRAFQSIAIGDGAPRECIRALAHTGDRDSTDIYLSIPWESLCAAVAKLDVQRRGIAEVVPIRAVAGGDGTYQTPTKPPTRGATSGESEVISRVSLVRGGGLEFWRPRSHGDHTAKLLGLSALRCGRIRPKAA